MMDEEKLSPEMEAAADPVVDAESVVAESADVSADTAAPGDGAPEAADSPGEAADAAGAEAAEAGAAPAPEPNPLDEALKEQAALRDQLLRARAEFDNYRKRMSREQERTRRLAAEGLLRELLPVVDNLERALEHAENASSGLAEGVRMVLKQFADVLQNQGLEPIPAVGETFDPEVHEALSRMPSPEHPEGTVALEYERGYRLGDYVLRPAKVVVSTGAAASAADAADGGGNTES